MDQPYQAYTGQLVAPESVGEQQASTLAGSVASQEAPDLAKAGQQWNTATMNQYMNPYIQSAINVPEQQLALQYGSQEAQLASRQSMNDAFGVGRTAAQSGVLNRNYETEFGNIQATGMAQAYNAAQGAFQQDTSRYANLAKETGALDTQNINSLLVTGQNERSIAQAQDTANYQQFENAQNWGLDRYQAVAGDITKAASNEVVPQKSSVLSGILGGATAGLGMVTGSGGLAGLLKGATSGGSSAPSQSQMDALTPQNVSASYEYDGSDSGLLGIPDTSNSGSGSGAQY
jgi:hypothetical protein